MPSDTMHANGDVAMSTQEQMRGRGRRSARDDAREGARLVRRVGVEDRGVSTGSSAWSFAPSLTRHVSGRDRCVGDLLVECADSRFARAERKRPVTLPLRWFVQSRSPALADIIGARSRTPFSRPTLTHAQARVRSRVHSCHLARRDRVA